MASPRRLTDPCGPQLPGPPPPLALPPMAVAQLRQSEGGGRGDGGISPRQLRLDLSVLTSSSGSNKGDRTPSPRDLTPKEVGGKGAKSKGRKTAMLFRRRSGSSAKPKFEFVCDENNFDRTFSLDSEIGRGSCGTVWKGRHLESGSKVAIKKLESFVNTMLDILPSLQQLRHPSILVYHGGLRVELTERTAFVWMVTEFCANGSLADLFMRRGARSCTEREIAAFVLPVLQALSYLQTLAMAHGAVSGRKIYVTEGFLVKLGGFGSPIVPDSTRVWPPEWHADPKNALPPTLKWDVWDLGQTVLRMAVHRGAPDTSVLEQTSTSFSPEFQGFVDCCLLKQAKQRPRPSELLEHPFCVHALNTYDLKETMRKFVFDAVQPHDTVETRERSFTASTVESPLLTLQMLAEENQRLREEIKGLHWERHEHTALIREMLGDLAELRSHSARLERYLAEWTPDRQPGAAAASASPL